MSNFVYWPYDEIKLQMNPEKSEVAVQTPWLEAKTAIDETSKPHVGDLCSLIDENKLGGEHLQLVNWFFGALSDFPFCYILPAPKPRSAANDDHAQWAEPMHELPLVEFTHLALLDALSSNEIDELLSYMSRTEWQWDFATATQFATVKSASGEDQVHPESFFSVARRYHFLELLDHPNSATSLKFFDQLEQDAFKKAASILVRQNHYVTEKCDESVRPGLTLAQSAKSGLEDFLKEEMGHDLILGVAMKALAEKPERVEVGVETRALMALLQFCAKKNFLGLCLVIDSFERSNYQKVDPMAKILIKAGYEKAAQQINRHMHINDAGGHENIAMGLLKNMTACNHAYCLEALKMAELVTLIMVQIPQSVARLFKIALEHKETIH